MEAALTVPFLLALVFSIVHGAAYLHAGNVAHAAAQLTFESARTLHADDAEAVAAGTAFASTAGALAAIEVRLHSSGDRITVTVSGEAPTLVPGLPLRVERSVTGVDEAAVLR